MRHIGLLFFLVGGVHLLVAQNVQVFASVSQDTVLVNTPFEVRFTLLNGQGSWQLPELTGLQILSGPNRSTQIQIVNGDMSKQSVDSYYVRATEPGDYVIERAQIEVEGQWYETEPVIVRITDDPSLVSPAKEESPFSLFGGMKPDSDRLKKNSTPPVLKKYPKKKF